MKSNKIKLVLLVGATLAAVSAFGIAQGVSAPKKPLPVEAGAKNFQIVDITPLNQTAPIVHVVYNFDKSTVTTVFIRGNDIEVGEPVSLLKATHVEVASANSKQEVGVSRMNINRVIEVAKQTAIKNGYQLKDYLEPTATFDSKDKEWIVTLDHKPPAFPGSRSLVSVNDQNGNISLLRGQ